MEREVLVDTRDANQVIIDLSLREPARVIEEDDEPNGLPAIQTRKGLPSITVVPLFEIEGEYYLDADRHRPYEKKQPLETYKRSVRLSRRGFPKALLKHNEDLKIDELFEYWHKEPLLRNCVPLVLNAEGHAVVGTTQIKLDDVLGIVYEST